MSLHDNRFNTPAEMLVRLVFASRYFFFIAGLFLAISAVAEKSVFDAMKSAALFSCMIAGHAWLKRTGKIEECDRVLEGMFSGYPGDENDRLNALLRRREALEERRGTPGFDPWEVQAVRREISDYHRRHPSVPRDPDERW